MPDPFFEDRIPAYMRPLLNFRDRLRLLKARATRIFSPPPPCPGCGSMLHSYCHGDGTGKYVLGHETYFGRIIGKCPKCNGLIGSALGRCDSGHCHPVPGSGL